MNAFQQEELTHDLQQTNDLISFVSSALTYWDEENDMTIPERRGVGLLLWQCSVKLNNIHADIEQIAVE